MSAEFVRKTIKLNKELWDKFQLKIEEEYGTTYKYTSQEIEKAIENYIDNDVLDIEKTRSKINNLNDENKDLQKNVDDLKSENVNLNDKLLLSKTETKKHQDTIDDLEQKIASSLDRIDSLNDRITVLEKEVDELNRSNEKLVGENEELLDENKRFEEKYFEQVEQTNRLVKENTKIKNKREHAQERLNKTQDELNDTLKRLEKYSFAIGQIKNMSFIDRIFNRLPEEIKELQPGIDEKEKE